MTAAIRRQDAAEQVDVAIVGYGPVGALLANLLGRDGIRTAVFERDAEVYKLPRAVHFDDEIMRTLHSLGLSEDVLAYTAPMYRVEYRTADGDVLIRFETPQVPTDQGWRLDYMFHQPALEATLRRSVSERDAVSVFLEHEAVSIEECDEHVELVVRDRETDEVRRVEARYVVGCDGANSFVRRSAGLALSDLEFDEPWLVVDVAVKGDRDAVGLPDHVIQLCDPARPTTFVPVSGPYVRWEFMLKPGEGVEMRDPAKVDELIAGWCDPNDVDVIRSAVYDFHALVASEWRTRRILLAGDSAHQTPPFLGQGMCAGMRDAANLAWKLSLVLRGEATDGLLSTYESERDPHVRSYIRVAVETGRVICVQDEEQAAARDAGFLSQRSPDVPMPGKPLLGPGLFDEDALLARQLGLQAPVRDAEGNPCMLDDVFGHGFALLVRGNDEVRLDAPGRALVDRLPVAVIATGAIEEAGAYTRWFDEHGCDAVLVRPDYAIFGAATGDDAPSHLLARLAQQLQT